MSFYTTYELIDLVNDDGIKTFRAKEIASGRTVLVHLFTRPQSLEMQALLKKVEKLPAGARDQILAQGEHEGTPYVVTGEIAPHGSFREWLVNQKASVDAAPAGKPSGPSMAADDPFAALFKKPPAPVAAAPQTKAQTEDFRHLIETPTTKQAAVRPAAPPPPIPGAVPEGTRIMSVRDLTREPSGPGEFTRMFQAVPEQTPAPAPVHDSPGEFTRMFKTGGSAEEAPVAPPAKPPQEPGEFTRMFQAPAKAEEPPKQQEGEFTRMFASPAPPAAAAAPPAAPLQATPPRANEPGEFTRMFDSPLKPAPLNPHQGPASMPVQPAKPAPVGEFTSMFGTGSAPPPIAPMSTPTPRPPASGSATNVFQAPQYRAPAPPVQSGPGEFTTVMSRPAAGGVLAEAAAAAPLEKKGGMKTYLPLILFGVFLLIVLIAIVVFFAMRKH